MVQFTQCSLDCFYRCALTLTVLAPQAGYCKPGDAVVALHRIGAASVIKIIDLK